MFEERNTYSALRPTSQTNKRFSGTEEGLMPSASERLSLALSALSLPKARVGVKRDDELPVTSHAGVPRDMGSGRAEAYWRETSKGRRLPSGGRCISTACW